MTTLSSCPTAALEFMDGDRYAPAVSVFSGQLPPGWDNPISDEDWPTALLRALRQDVGAIASPRAIATLRQWQAALDSPDLERRREAQRRLSAVGAALLQPPAALDDTDDNAFTVDAFPAPVSPRFAAHEDHPAQPVRLDSAAAAILSSPAVAEDYSAANLDDEAGTVDAVQRAAVASAVHAERPRAAMHHVRSLYATLKPFADELMPLAFERRSRRFWARWREVAGDYGVRRPFVEELLRTSDDANALVCALIAEVQAVDPASVADLIERLDAPAQSAR